MMLTYRKYSNIGHHVLMSLHCYIKWTIQEMFLYMLPAWHIWYPFCWRYLESSIEFKFNGFCIHISDAPKMNLKPALACNYLYNICVKPWEVAGFIQMSLVVHSASLPSMELIWRPCCTTTRSVTWWVWSGTDLALWCRPVSGDTFFSFFICFLSTVFLLFRHFQASCPDPNPSWQTRSPQSEIKTWVLKLEEKCLYVRAQALSVG